MSLGCNESRRNAWRQQSASKICRSPTAPYLRTGTTSCNTLSNWLRWCRKDDLLESIAVPVSGGPPYLSFLFLCDLDGAAKTPSKLSSRRVAVRFQTQPNNGNGFSRTSLGALNRDCCNIAIT